MPQMGTNATTATRIVSPMPTGSGAIVVHDRLANAIPGYQVVPYSPTLTYCPPSLRWFVKKPPADIIHTTPDHARFFRRRNVPLVATFHNYVIDAFMRPYSTAMQRLHYATDLKWFLKAALKKADRFTAVSQFTANRVREDLGFDGDIEVIPNGVDTEMFSPLEHLRDGDQIRVLFPGNPSRRKGAHWLPEIAARLPDNVQIVCATGLRGGWTQDMAAAGIEMLGGVAYDDMPALYRSVDALLLPTVREGDSLVVLEAMSAGLPVVASNCSSLPERVAHGTGGFLPEVGDVQGFAESLVHLTDPAARHAMGRFNRERAVTQFSLKHMIARYVEVFSSLSSKSLYR